MGDYDIYDEQAEHLLPCDQVHDSRCPCRYRFTVAAALREMATKIERQELIIARHAFLLNSLLDNIN